MAARSGGAGAKEEQVGRKARCRAPGSRRGGCHPRGSGGVGAVRPSHLFFFCIYVYVYVYIYVYVYVYIYVPGCV